MGILRRIGRKVLGKVAGKVGRDDLFEQPGERSPASPLPPRAAPAPAPAPTPASAPAPAPSPSPAPAAAPSPAKAAPKRAPAKSKSKAKAAAAEPSGGKALPAERPTQGFVADIPRLQALVGPGHGLRLVNHWASWCLPCIEEFPHLISLHKKLGDRVEFVGISWDMFDKRGDQEDIVEHIENYADGHEVLWPSLLVDEKVGAEAFFEALEISYDKIPQTWLVAPDGTILHRVDGAIDGPGAEALAAVIEGALG